jgi:hypothetical protein
MSLFSSQTIFSILFTLLIGVALYYYIRYKTRILELTVREQAKVLQSVIMNMNSNNENIMNMVQGRSHEELTSDAVGQDMNRVREVNSNNELIEVSDDSDSDSDGDSSASSESESESSTSSESDSESGSDDESEHGEEPVEDVADNGTRKIVFNGGNDSHVVEHLDGPDVKVIELTHPLYPKNENEVRNGDGDDADEDDEADNESEDDADEDEDSDSESISSELDGPHEPSGIHENYENHENHEIKENADINQPHLEIETISETISEATCSLDNISVKTVFKTKETKESETHSEYTSMNVQSLRQLLKSKLTSEGTNMSEASINKLTKKELIKHLS